MKLDLKVFVEFVWLKVSDEVSLRDVQVMAAGYRKLCSLGIPWVVVDASEAKASPQTSQDMLAAIQKVRERVPSFKSPSILMMPGLDMESELAKVTEPARSMILTFLRLYALTNQLKRDIEWGEKVKQGKLTMQDWVALKNPSMSRDLPQLERVEKFRADLLSLQAALEKGQSKAAGEDSTSSTGQSIPEKTAKAPTSPIKKFGRRLRDVLKGTQAGSSGAKAGGAG